MGYCVEQKSNNFSTPSCMEEKKSKKENGLMKSLSLIVDRSPTRDAAGQEDTKKKSQNHTYSFLAALRKVKKLSTENIQNIYKAYNMVSP